MPTNGNALAGSLAASLQAVEIAKLVAGDREHAAAGREVLFEARSHALVSSRLVRNPRCRFDHASWRIEASGDRTLRDALALGGSDAELFVPDSAFVSRLACEACRLEGAPWRLRESLGARERRCPRCGAERPVSGFDLVERIAPGAVPPELLDRPLFERGLRAGEVFGVGGANGSARYFALGPGCDRCTAPAAPRESATVVVAGLGNIGSYLAPLVARIPAVGRVVLCDPDRYEPHQLDGQDIDARAVGRGKAEVQAERLCAIRPALRVEIFIAPVERLPQGRLVGAVVASCLDTRVARLRLAARAWRVGSPFVDAAVGGGASLLARTTVYLPEAGAACFECAFDHVDYAALEQAHPCAAAAAAAA